MWTVLRVLLLTTLVPPAPAAGWGLGAGSGAFLFGDFVTFESTVGTEESSVETEEVLAGYRTS